MPRLGSFYGVVGAILVLFAALSYIITRGASPYDALYISIHVLIGLGALIAYVVSARDSFQTFFGQRSTKYGAGSALYTLLFIAILVLVNYLSTRHYHRFDMTEAGVFSLSPQSVNVVKQLQQPLEINAFVEAGADPQLADLLATYRYASDKVTFHILDPDKQPELAERYKVSTIPAIHLQSGERTTIVNKVAEEDLTNGIIKVTRAETKKIYFLEGHGEPDPMNEQDPRGYGQLRTALENESHEVKQVVLTEGTPVPDDAAVLVVGGPERSLLDHEVQAIDAYLKKGKRALFLLNARTTPELATYLHQWNVQVGNNVIVDEQIQLLKGRTFTLNPLVTSYGQHPITAELIRQGTAALTSYGISRSVAPQENGTQGPQATTLVQTSAKSWAETDMESLFQRQSARLDEGTDQKGPISLAVAVTAGAQAVDGKTDGATRLAVFGNAQFANNQLIGQYFNRDLLLNTLNWLIGEEGLMSIRAATLRSSRVQFSTEQARMIFYLGVLILPEILLIAGLAVWWKRQ